MRTVFCGCHNSAHMTCAVCLSRDGLVTSEGTCRSALTDLSRQLTEQTKVFLGLILGKRYNYPFLTVMSETLSPVVC